MKHTYFPGLNTLRLYAALSVVVGHLLLFHTFDHNLEFLLSLVITTSYDAVSLFFVLSGFLITYLLLDEDRRTGDVDVRSFYIRRALRIWPLYFLILVVSTLLVPSNMLPPASATVSLLLLSAHVSGAFMNLGIFEHLWSIGVEEWFYLVWPILLRWRHLLLVCAAIMGVRLLIAFTISPQFALYGDRYIYGGWLALFNSLRFECMAIGALGAWVYSRGHWTLRWIYKLQVPIYAALVAIIMLPFVGGILYDLVAALIFIGLILNVSTNPRSILKLETRLLSELGKVTYGVYVYHFLIIYLICTAWPFPTGVLADCALVAVVVGATLVVSLLSYHLFEKRFLRFKPYRRMTAPAVVTNT